MAERKVRELKIEVTRSSSEKSRKRLERYKTELESIGRKHRNV